MKKMKICQALDSIQPAKNNPTLRNELILILAYLLKQSKEFILAHPDQSLSSLQLRHFQFLARRRIQKEPLAYILGGKEFYGNIFQVNQHTLIPRPETEMLVEAALEFIIKLPPQTTATIADIGTGSGCIIISLIKTLQKTTPIFLRNFSFYASDISQKALSVAHTNARRHQIDTIITFLPGHLLVPLLKKKTGLKQSRHLIILANLPYLSSILYQTASPEVKNYEPCQALWGGDDGLSYYRQLFQQIHSFPASIPSKITLFCEISPEQKSTFKKEAYRCFPYSSINFKKDLSGKYRLVNISL